MELHFITFPATIMLNSRATTESYTAEFGPKNVASTDTPNDRPLAAASPRSVVGGGVVHFACVGSCWQVLSLGWLGNAESLLPHAAAAMIAAAQMRPPVTL